MIMEEFIGYNVFLGGMSECSHKEPKGNYLTQKDYIPLLQQRKTRIFLIQLQGRSHDFTQLTSRLQVSLLKTTRSKL